MASGVDEVPPRPSVDWTLEAEMGRGTVVGDTCELEVRWTPVWRGVRPYCCDGCAAGGPCSCSYDDIYTKWRPLSGDQCSNHWARLKAKPFEHLNHSPKGPIQVPRLTDAARPVWSDH
jgi:hypothetical protein